MKKPFKNGDTIRISGKVNWGGDMFRVSTIGEVIEWKKGPYALVNMEYVGGDFGVCTHVAKRYIFEANE